MNLQKTPRAGFWRIGTLALGLVVFGLVAASPVQANRQYEFQVKGKRFSPLRITETANVYANLLRFDVVGMVRGQMVSSTIDVFVPKGRLSPREVLSINLMKIITYGAGAEYMILTELILPDNRRKALIRTTVELGHVLQDLVAQGAPVMNQAAKQFVSGFAQHGNQVAKSLVGILVGLNDTIHGYRPPPSSPPQPWPEASSVRIRTNKRVYGSDEDIIISYSGLPGNGYDWITLVPASHPDFRYGPYTYNYGKKSGQWTCGPQRPGDYEVRVYFNWSAGGYIVQHRYPVKIRAPRP